MQYEIEKGALTWITSQGFNCWLLEWIDYSPHNDKIKQWCLRNKVKYTEQPSADAPYLEYSAFVSNIENYDLRFTLGVNTQIYEDKDENYATT